MCRLYTVLSSERGRKVHPYLREIREGPESSVMLPLSGNRTSLNIVFIVGWCIIAILDSRHRLFIALLGSSLTVLITSDARCLNRTTLYYQS